MTRARIFRRFAISSRSSIWRSKLGGKLRLLGAGGGSSGETANEVVLSGAAGDIACCFAADKPVPFPVHEIPCKRTIKHRPPKSSLRSKVETGDILFTMSSSAPNRRRNRSFLNLAPSVIRVEFLHRSGGLGRGFPQVFLKEQSILVDDECHHSRVAVFSWIGNEGEPANHLPVDQIVLRTAFCVATLLGQHTEVVAVKRSMRARLYAISVIGRECDHRAERARRLIFGRLPVQAVLLAGVTDDLKGVLV